ncbi:hypothetical protein B0T26DRAFT_874971 [Lasiosphaeria miniovina]|uniref:Uncharacterized protein n=1 Tax=Lasiosphaeria miniovina TaxID=1954250 RepID=A0AA40A6H1_9PEZI|nr:uncharacterized protein B0T26DRAFT_874971 [Lasiosphaeria miniovina]KAK0710041.1 hypothetical protein B0T26DRAFT_874971 [Lasiosphaeria miniovina]
MELDTVDFNLRLVPADNGAGSVLYHVTMEATRSLRSLELIACEVSEAVATSHNLEPVLWRGDQLVLNTWGRWDVRAGKEEEKGVTVITAPRWSVVLPLLASGMYRGEVDVHLFLQLIGLEELVPLRLDTTLRSRFGGLEFAACDPVFAALADMSIETMGWEKDSLVKATGLPGATRPGADGDDDDDDDDTTEFDEDGLANRMRALQIDGDAPVPLDDAFLFSNSSPDAMYSAVACALVRYSERRDGDVLVIGHDSARLGSEIAYLGVPVHEWEHETLSYGDVDTLCLTEWRAVVIDAAAKGEDEESTTTRNLQYALAFVERNPDTPVLTRLHDDLRMPCTLSILRVPGLSLANPFKAWVWVGDARSWQKTSSLHVAQACWAYVCYDGNQDVVLDFELAPADYGNFFSDCCHFKQSKYSTESGGPRYRVDCMDFCHLLSSRFWLEAKAHAQTSAFAAHVRAARNPTMLYSALRIHHFWNTTPAARRELLSNLFRPRRVAAVVGVNRELADRVPGTACLITARYDALAGLCVPTSRPVDAALVELFSDPSAGVLLNMLHQAKRELGVMPVVAQHHRVLPFESLAVLASRELYKLLAGYVVLARRARRNPLHKWELQFLLWALTVFGTYDDKIEYMEMLYNDMAETRGLRFDDSPPPRILHTKTVRPESDIVHTEGPAAGNFIASLSALHINTQYLALDGDLDNCYAIAVGLQNAERGDRAGIYM